MALPQKMLRTFLRRALTYPIKLYGCLNTPVSLAWHKKTPPKAKYFLAILAAAAAIYHIHPDTIITLGPPTAIGWYFLARRINHKYYLKLVNEAKLLPTQNVKIPKYDETSVENVLRGINSEIDHFKKNVLKIVEQHMVDYVARQHAEGKISGVISALLDANNQVQLRLDPDFETLVLLQAEDGDAIVDFVKFSVPYYAGKEKDSRRVGVAEVTMLGVSEDAEINETNEAEESEHEKEAEESREWRMLIRLCTFRQFGRASEVVS